MATIAQIQELGLVAVTVHGRRWQTPVAEFRGMVEELKGDWHVQALWEMMQEPVAVDLPDRYAVTLVRAARMRPLPTPA